MTTITTSRLRIERFISGDLSLDDLEDADREDLADDYVPLRLTIGEDIIELAWPDGTECQPRQLAHCGICGRQWCGWECDEVHRTDDLADDLARLLTCMDEALEAQYETIRQGLAVDLDEVERLAAESPVAPYWFELVARRDVSAEAIAAASEYVGYIYDPSDRSDLDYLISEVCRTAGVIPGSVDRPGVYLDGTDLVAWAYDPADPSETIAIIREQVA